MIYYAIAVLFIALFYSQQLIVIYRNLKQHAIVQARALSEEPDKETVYPICAVVMFLCSMLMYSLTDNVVLSVFILLLAAVAYADMAIRWIPDVLIYLLIAVSLLDVDKHNIVLRGVGCVFFIVPPLVLNLYGYLKTKTFWIASGDFYVFFALGFWIQPEYSAAIMLMALLIGALLMRFCHSVPLVTCVFPFFIGYKLCEAYGVLLLF
ncbi:prepilin peptidase [Candidatus Symbiopectobacterium sp. 'North America']|uniref:prepilin peptidase n=1 Tax=Candidatus Symbiopectobacterium sp. 'North America' TaxID=2794574 RepID=UPI0018CBB314|nr:prepilin peptidase [Candidatus Symbiopectobacterium sp. 'North America']